MTTGGGAASKVYSFAIIAVFTLIIFAAAAGWSQKEPEAGPAARKRGEAVFKSACQSCHSLKYLGYKSIITPEATRRALGKAPPDLSLMAKARGKSGKGAEYIYALLIGYNDTPRKNDLFPYIVMPPPLAKNDPEFTGKAKDVAAFLLYAAEPSAAERRGLGRYVLSYMLLLTALLYLLNRKIWKRGSTGSGSV